MTDGKAWRLGSALTCLALLTACAGGGGTPETVAPAADETSIVLSDSGVEVDGQAAPAGADAAVYVGADIVYYEDGRDETYGEGTEADSHDPEEAEAHTVVTITQPGTYAVSGTLSAGQIAVDLGGGCGGRPVSGGDADLERCGHHLYGGSGSDLLQCL